MDAVSSWILSTALELSRAMEVCFLISSYICLVSEIELSACSLSELARFMISSARELPESDRLSISAVRFCISLMLVSISPADSDVISRFDARSDVLPELLRECVVISLERFCIFSASF